MTKYEPLPPWPWYDGEPLGRRIVETCEPLAVGKWAMHKTDRRVYRRLIVKADEPYRHTTGGPVPRYEFEPVKIIGETRRSWIVGHFNAEEKIEKKIAGNVLLSVEQVEDRLWVGRNARRIAEQVGRCNHSGTLREVARVIGYQEEDDENG